MTFAFNDYILYQVYYIHPGYGQCDLRILIRNNKGVKSRSVVTRQQKLLPSAIQIQLNTQAKRKRECLCGKEILVMKTYIYQNLQIASQNCLV